MWRVSLVVFALLAIVLLPALGEEELDSSSVEVGAAFGLMWFPDIEPLSTVGGAMGFSVTPQLSFKASYWNAGISFLGVSLISINVFDISLVLDTSPAERFGFYVVGGGGLLLAGLLGEGGSALYASAGLGLRVSPVEMVKIHLEYRALIRNSILHTIQVGVSGVF